MEGAPAFSTPPHLNALGLMRAWFTDPPGAVVQFTRPTRGTVEMAEWTVTAGLARLRGRFPTAQDMTLVFDLSLMEGRDPAARAVMLAKAHELRGMFARVRLIPPIKTTPVYLTTLHAAALLLNAVGMDVKIFTSLDEVIRSLKLRPAAAVETTTAR